MAGDVGLDHLAELVFMGSLHCKLTLSPCPHCPLWKEVSAHPTLKEWGAVLHPLERENLQNLGFSCTDSSLLPHLFISSLPCRQQCALMGTDLTRQVRIQHYFPCCSNCSRPNPWELFQLAAVSLCGAPSRCFLEHMLLTLRDAPASSGIS